MRIVRHTSTDTETEGELHLVGYERTLHTLERPWIAGKPGGMPFVSAVPVGIYQLIRHARPNGDLVFALRNPDLGVYYSSENVPDAGGRFLILIHSANKVSQIQGCIAPGLSSIAHDGGRFVTSSRKAMEIIKRHYVEGESLIIEDSV